MIAPARTNSGIAISVVESSAVTIFWATRYKVVEPPEIIDASDANPMLAAIGTPINIRIINEMNSTATILVPPISVSY